MANDYVLIQSKDEGLGQIAVSNTVINHIIAIVIDENPHIFLEETRSRKITPSVKQTKDGLVIALKIRVKYGQNVEKTCLKLQQALQNNLELMVDYKNPIIDLNVVGFKFN